jgi:hypothetical protein
MCRTVHRAPVLRRSRPLRTLRTQKADHYMLRARIKMRSGAYVALCQHTLCGTRQGQEEFTGRFITRGTAWLTPVCVRAA